jgi:hypothetical protein
MSDQADETAPEVRQLARSTARLHNSLAWLSEDQLSRRPAPEEWSAWDIAYHVAQIEIWYLAKLCEAAAPDRAAALHIFVELWQKLRVEGLALADQVPADHLDRTGLLGGVPDWTPRELIERMAAHDQEHADQATAAWKSEGGGAAPRSS